MRQKSGSRKSAGENIAKDIKRATRKQYSCEEKIRIALDGCAAKTASLSSTAVRVYPKVSITKGQGNFMEAGNKRLTGDTARAVTTDEVKNLRRDARDLKEAVAETSFPADM